MCIYKVFRPSVLPNINNFCSASYKIKRLPEILAVVCPIPFITVNVLYSFFEHESFGYADMSCFINRLFMTGITLVLPMALLVSSNCIMVGCWRYDKE